MRLPSLTGFCSEPLGRRQGLETTDLLQCGTLGGGTRRCPEVAPVHTGIQSLPSAAGPRREGGSGGGVGSGRRPWLVGVPG